MVLMPAKKQPTQTEPAKTKVNKKQKAEAKTENVSQEKPVEVTVSQPVLSNTNETKPVVEKQSVVTETKSVDMVGQTNQTSSNLSKKMIRKPGRTILVKSLSGKTIGESVFDSLSGLQSKAQTKSSSSYFLTFDSVDSALNAYRKLKEGSSDYKVKYSTYRIFFTMNGLNDSTDYNQVKKELVEHVTKQTGSSVLYCKFYRKDSKFIGCGDLTIDTLEGMNSLLNKEGGKKEFSFGSFSGTFYRYNGKSKSNSSTLSK